MPAWLSRTRYAPPPDVHSFPTRRSSDLTGAALAGPYAASKAGMVALTQSHARELAPHGISVNAVLPGYVDTPMAAQIGRHTSELQSPCNLVCRLLLAKKKFTPSSAPSP